jgi:predicted Rossmann fold flavoprotein
VLGPLATERTPLKGLDGVRARAAVTLVREGRELFREEGEVLFRPFGVSGIVSFDLSRFAEEGDVAQLDFFPSYDVRALVSLLTERRLRHPADPLKLLLDGMLHPRLAQAVVRAAAAHPDTCPDQALLEKLATLMKAYRLRITAGPSPLQAQVTRGGLATEGFDASTLRSLHHPRLFAAGECLDIDGPCGGFNLHWAWASGYTAGTAAGKAATLATVYCSRPLSSRACRGIFDRASGRLRPEGASACGRLLCVPWACRPVLAENSPPDCFPGARTQRSLGRLGMTVGVGMT